MKTKPVSYLKFFMALALAILGFSAAAPVFACTATVSPTPPLTPMPSPTPRVYVLEDWVDNAQFVILGTVTGNKYDQAEIQVERYFKGNGPEIITIYGFGGGTLCEPYVSLGERRIFFANGDPNDRMYSTYFSVGDAAIAVTDEIIAEVIAITNQSLPPDESTSSATATQEPDNTAELSVETTETTTPEPSVQATDNPDNRQVLLGFSILILVSSLGLIVLFVYVRRRSTR